VGRGGGSFSNAVLFEPPKARADPQGCFQITAGDWYGRSLGRGRCRARRAGKKRQPLPLNRAGGFLSGARHNHHLVRSPICPPAGRGASSRPAWRASDSTRCCW